MESILQSGGLHLYSAHCGDLKSIAIAALHALGGLFEYQNISQMTNRELAWSARISIGLSSRACFWR
jgi:hypothetical protein